MTLKRIIRLWILEIQQKRLIPEAYWNEAKRVKLCEIDNEIMKIQREVKT